MSILAETRDDWQREYGDDDGPPVEEHEHRCPACGRGFWCAAPCLEEPDDLTCEQCGAGFCPTCRTVIADQRCTCREEDA